METYEEWAGGRVRGRNHCLKRWFGRAGIEGLELLKLSTTNHVLKEAKINCNKLRVKRYGDGAARILDYALANC